MAEKKQDMTVEREAKILEGAIEYYGTAAQTDKAIEEMAELTKALLKFRGTAMATQNEWAALRGNIREEMADVSIMLRQLELIYGDYAEEELGKLERLADRIKI